MGKQASKQHLLTQVEGLAAPQWALMWTCGLGAPAAWVPQIEYSRTNTPDTHLPTPGGWTAELAGVSSSDDWVRTRDLPRPNPAP